MEYGMTVSEYKYMLVLCWNFRTIYGCCMGTEKELGLSYWSARARTCKPFKEPRISIPSLANQNYNPFIPSMV